MSKRPRENLTIPKVAKPEQSNRGEKDQSFLQSLNTLKSDKRLLLFLAIITLPVGIASQLSWIEFRCIGEPFIGSLKATCKDNLWRMIFGGPLAFIMSYGLAAWINTTRKFMPRWRLILPFACLLPTLILPFIHNEQTHNRIIQGIAIFFLFGFVVAAREKLVRIFGNFLAKPRFQIKIEASANQVTFVFLGEPTDGERELMFSSVLGALQEYATEKRNIAVNLTGITGFSGEYSWIFHAIQTFARFSGASVTWISANKLLKNIERCVSLDNARLFADRPPRHGRK